MYSDLAHMILKVQCLIRTNILLRHKKTQNRLREKAAYKQVIWNNVEVTFHQLPVRFHLVIIY
jgi:hypothetical protein